MADENQQTNELIVTEPFRIAFPNIAEPSAPVMNGKPQGDPMYSLVMIFDNEEQVKEMKRAAVRMAKAKWGDNVNLNELQFPFKDGNQEARKSEEKGKDGSFFKDKIVAKANSKFQPGVVGPDKKEIDLTMQSQAIYSGCYGRAELNCVAYDGPGNAPDGVKFYINFLMKTADGDRIAGRTASDVFANVQGSQTHEDPTGGMPSSSSGDPADELPF